MSPPAHSPLRRLRPFRDVSPDDLAQLVAAGRWEELPAGATVSDQGDDALSAILIVEGRLRVRVTESARDLGDLWPGSVVGENALFGVRTARSYSVSTVTRSRLLHLTRDQLRSLTGNGAVAALQRHVIEVTGRRLQTADLDMRKVWRGEDQARHAARKAAEEQAAAAEAGARPGLFERLKTLMGVSS